ncbi:MAG: Gfo/Idh/MocA family protein [Acidimicrobiales bacterium]
MNPPRRNRRVALVCDDVEGARTIPTLLSARGIDVVPLDSEVTTILVDGVRNVGAIPSEQLRNRHIVAWFNPDSDSTRAPVHRTLPNSEWFIKLDRAAFAQASLAEEFPIVGPIAILEVDGADACGWINEALTDRTVIATESRADHVVTYVGISLRALLSPSRTNTALLDALMTSHSSQISPSRSYGVGVVGYGPFGGMGHYHGTASNATPGLSFVAAIDPSDDRRRQAEQDFPGIATFRSIDELEDHDDIDIAIVATPPLSHFPLAKQLLSMGKHVVIEKPMCISVKEADELISLADSHDRTLTVNQNRRWDQDFRTVRQLIDLGALGDVFNIETFVGGFEHPCREWHSDESISGGIAYDWGAHHIDWIIQLFGDAPVSISTQAHKRKWFEVTNLDQIRIHMVFPGGREATFYQSEIAAIRRPKFYIQGTRGTLVGEYRPLRFESVHPHHGYERIDYHHAEAPAQLTLATYRGLEGVSTESVPLLPPDRFGIHRNLSDHLRFGTPLDVRPEDVREVVRVLERSHEQSKQYLNDYRD